MGKFAKWIGGGLGWSVLGPIGGLIGFIIGSVIDSAEVNVNQYQHPYDRTQRQRPTTQGDYMVSLLVLVAAVLKADGKVLRSELDYVKSFFKQNFGVDTAAEAVKSLKGLLEQDIPVAEVCHQIKRYMDYSSRLQLVHFLFGIAAADREIDPREKVLVKNIAYFLGISDADYGSIESMFVPSTDWAYQILEIPSTATEQEIKKAYRKMAVKYHPDKVSYLGEDVQKAAKEKFQKVNEAYEAIRQERKIV
ncbi:co-chaperone protein DjlA [Prolixibacter bellariivorans]|uniref:Co-chaperone protein DjlA n=1 Tax=Prolixibacter bellariivorans TaxID=314319 RepID=A0A5M4B2E3_9BACT|nr:TerB family tellurite resistance protein [Prolixibacter bellariivorans]GET34282.1 co-chaperone protein DjlA [Prolixibacter bellariivorans]